MEPLSVKLLCTGNPNDPTVASAVKKLWPTADFASRTTGYDLRFWDAGSETHFRQQITKYDTFINSSFICNGGQINLLETAFDQWVHAGITGTIINIGSSAEWLGVDSQWGNYSIQKRALRDRSLQLNQKNGIKTVHLIAGGLNDGKPCNSKGLDLLYIAHTIQWILGQSFAIPLIYLEASN